MVLHIAPESAAGGPLGAVRDGDIVRLDVEARRIDVELSDEEIARRLADRPVARRHYERGYGALYAEHVTQADTGADFDFLIGVPGEEPDTEPLGLLTGWIAGW